MRLTIFHNPACGTFRDTLAMIRHAGIEPVVVEYLKNPPTGDELRGLHAAMGITVRQLLRRNGTAHAARRTTSSCSTIRSGTTTNCSTSSACISS